MFKDFYEKNIYKKFYNKTTPEEKKEVVKNTGDWFPEKHENKIKGMENVIANYNHTGAEQPTNNTTETRETKEVTSGYKLKNCEVCGRGFMSYRNVSKYCKECSLKKQKEYDAAYKRKKYAEKKAEEARIHNNAYKRAKQRGTTYEYELLKIKKGIDPLRAPNRKAEKPEEKQERLNELQKNYRKNNNVVMTPVGEADLRTRECASKRASNRGTEYLDELKRIIDGVEPIRTKSTTITAEYEQKQKEAEQSIENGAKEIDKAITDNKAISDNKKFVFDTVKKLAGKGIEDYAIASITHITEEEVSAMKAYNTYEDYCAGSQKSKEDEKALYSLELLQRAVDIVRTVKETEDVMQSVNSVYETLKKLFEK